MERIKLPLEENPKDLERFKAELKQKPCRDWTLGELQKFCQNTNMCSQECPVVDLCDKFWDYIIPGDWKLPSTFTERDRNDAYEEENNKEKEKIPPLCEVLRVQPCQEFIYKGIWYRITSHGERQAWFQSGQKWCWDSSCATLEEMIQERDKIQIGVHLTNEQKEELLRIKRMLPEAKKVFLTDNEVKVKMNSCDYKLNLDVVMPEGLDYEFEEEEK